VLNARRRGPFAARIKVRRGVLTDCSSGLDVEGRRGEIHRSLIGDALLARGVHVEDIMSVTSRREHALTPFAKVDGLNVFYPAVIEQAKLPLS
jgi:hypothetical protein